MCCLLGVEDILHVCESVCIECDQVVAIVVLQCVAVIREILCVCESVCIDCCGANSLAHKYKHTHKDNHTHTHTHT